MRGEYLHPRGHIKLASNCFFWMTKTRTVIILRVRLQTLDKRVSRCRRTVNYNREVMQPVEVVCSAGCLPSPNLKRVTIGKATIDEIVKTIYNSKTLSINESKQVLNFQVVPGEDF